MGKEMRKQTIKSLRTLLLLTLCGTSHAEMKVVLTDDTGTTYAVQPEIIKFKANNREVKTYSFLKLKPAQAKTTPDITLQIDFDCVTLNGKILTLIKTEPKTGWKSFDEQASSMSFERPDNYQNIISTSTNQQLTTRVCEIAKTKTGHH